tara:strand:+ start:42294 stop:42458 length:165 start_codon:yes stop_codon:yes gene_type:complete
MFRSGLVEQVKATGALAATGILLRLAESVLYAVAGLPASLIVTMNAAMDTDLAL